MSLICEDGSGKSDSESYISVADASTYFSNRGVTAWAALDTGEATAVREAALRKATDYMTAVYRDRWEGVRYTEDQALDWPRSGVVRDSWAVGYDEVPTEVARACAELALKAASADLQPDLTQGVVREKVGPIETEYDRYSPQATRYSFIDNMLAPFLKSRGGCSVPLVRA
ncbi:MAG: hypothetical protein PHY29_12070 [Syntrophales bacterium]|nr:hypothetical protein [Syntrophales bacterium]